MLLPLAALIFWSNSSARDWRGACRRALAKVESLQIVTRHGYPYPLMQRFLAEAGPRGKIWGGLPGAATTPPDAVVLMEPFGRALPLYLQPTGARGRYRAAGATDPLGVDLPESRARAQVAQLPPPRFAGWEHADGLGPAENMWRATSSCRPTR